MCDFKVGDLVVHKGTGNKYVVRSALAARLEFERFDSDYPASEFKLVERKVAHTFAAGDKGKTRQGRPYEVLAIFGPTAQLAVLIDGVLNRRENNGAFAYDQKRKSVADLMPPTKTVWRVELTGVNNPRNSGLLDMSSTRYYNSKELAEAGIARGKKIYTSVKGPFSEERDV